MTSKSSDLDQSSKSGSTLSASTDGENSSRTLRNKDTMKRSAAKQRIEQYHHQLLEGCGNDDCTNVFCASSPQFCYKDLDSNSAAAIAVELLTKNAPLCKDKVLKKTVRHDASGSLSAKETAVNEDRLSVPTEPSSETPAQAAAEPTKDAAFSSVAGKLEARVYLTEKKLLEVLDFCRQTGSWTDLNRYLGILFRPEDLMLSFPRMPDVDVPVTKPSKKELMRSIEYDRDKDLDDLESVQLWPDNDNGGASKDSARASTVLDTAPGRPLLLIDVESMRRSFSELFSIPDLPFLPLVVNAIVFLARTLEFDLRSSNVLSRRDEYVNLFLIIMEIPALGSPEFLETAMPQFCKTVGLLPERVQAQLARIWSTCDAERLATMVGCVQQLITVRIVCNYQSSPVQKSVHDDDAITGAVKLLKILYHASALGGRWDSFVSKSGLSDKPIEEIGVQQAIDNDSDDRERFENPSLLAQYIDGGYRRRTKWHDPLGRMLGINLVDCRAPLVPAEEFVNEPLSEIVEMDKDFINYRAALEGELVFSFMLHPFVLTPTVKHVAMYFDNRIRMMNERRAAILQGMLGERTGTSHLRLRVRRDHLIDDALINKLCGLWVERVANKRCASVLWLKLEDELKGFMQELLEMISNENPQDLRKQLFVEFEGEQGIDEGGPSKEFFQLIVEDLFNPDIGMFTYDEETHMFWFNSVSFETEAQYKLIGILLGLAIYNNVILDIHFPMVVYRKLTGRPGTFEDLKSSHPTLARSLQEMLTYEGDVAADIMQPFCIDTVDVFGHSHTHLLKENGQQIMVSNETRQEFVDLYADFLLNKSVDRQFSAFRHGFQMVTDESPLQLLFRPDEIELLICGSKNYDFNDLERSTQYDGGFTADSPTIRYFWETVHEWSEDQKRKLLQFTTGSDRIPIGGLSQLKLVIARNGPDSDRLPTAHTCFNVLLLPEYESKSKLRDRLLKAISYFKGFGML